MLEDGLSYPFRGEWVGRILIGGVLSFFSFLFIPLLPLNGYFVNVLRDTARGNDDPPEFTDWGSLFVKGIGALLIVLAYAIVPMLVYGAIVTTFLGVGAAIGGDAGGFFAGFGFLSLLLLIPVLLFVYYLIPAALTNFALEGTVGAGFDFGTIGDVVFTTDYLLAVLLPIVVAVILWMATFVLAITVIGLLFLPFLQFYGQMAVFRMFGRAFHSVSQGV